MSVHTVACGTGTTGPFTLPARWAVTDVRARPSDPPDQRATVLEALAKPFGPSLAELVRSCPGQGAAGRALRVVIAITDLTRPCPDHLLVPALVASLEAAGVARSSITLLIGTGLHRPMDDREIEARLGADVIRGLTVVNHDAVTPAGLVTLDPLRDGVPVVLDRHALEADLLLATGMVEPHLYAGFSGGFKTIAIGCAGEATIGATHGPRFLDREGTRLGRLEGNPFFEAICEIGRRSGLAFVLDVVLDAQDRIVAAAAGRPEPVVSHLARIAADHALEPVEAGFDLAIAGVPHPKDSNFYQASRVPTYLQLGARPIVRDGGTILMAARCPEGMGEGVGERRFARSLETMSDPAAYVESRRQASFSGGEQRAYVMAKVLARTRVVLVGAQRPGDLSLGPVRTAPTIDQALALAGLDPGSAARVVVVEDPFRRLPVARQE